MVQPDNKSLLKHTQVLVLRFKIQGSRFSVQGSRFHVQGSRFWVVSSKQIARIDVYTPQVRERFLESDLPKMSFYKYQHSSPWLELACLNTATVRSFDIWYVKCDMKTKVVPNMQTFRHCCPPAFVWRSDIFGPIRKGLVHCPLE